MKLPAFGKVVCNNIAIARSISKTQAINTGPNNMIKSK